MNDIQKIIPPKQDVLGNILFGLIDMNVSVGLASAGLSSPAEAISAVVAKFIKLPIVVKEIFISFFKNLQTLLMGIMTK